MRDRFTKKFTSTAGLAALLSLLILSLVSIDVRAQGNAKPGPDVIVFPNGEKLIGHFESFASGTAKFKSDTLGEVNVDLNKVQQFQTSQTFAVIPKNVKLGRHVANAQIPQGTISVASQKVEVTPANGQPAQSTSVAEVNAIIDEASFQQALHHDGIFEKWKGAVVLGTSLVEATQNSLSINTAVNLVRATHPKIGSTRETVRLSISATLTAKLRSRIHQL